MTINVIAPEIDRLELLYKGGFQNNFLDNALRKVINRQIARDEADLEEIRQSLTEFESQYGLSSTDFWERFKAGEMTDTADFMEWNAFCKMEHRISKRLRILQDDEYHD